MAKWVLQTGTCSVLTQVAKRVVVPHSLQVEHTGEPTYAPHQEGSLFWGIWTLVNRFPKKNWGISCSKITLKCSHLKVTYYFPVSVGQESSVAKLDPLALDSW